MQIQRLNMDNSWLICWAGTSIILDPWLVGSEIDGFSWFNEQWHATEPVPLKDIGRTDIVLVSQPYLITATLRLSGSCYMTSSWLAVLQRNAS